MAKFWIDVLDSSSNKLGNGPIITAQNWEYTKRLDRAGSFRFSMPASDPHASVLVPKVTVTCYTIIDSTITTISSGIVDRIDTRISNDGTPMLEISGDDLLRELTYRIVGSLAIGSESTPAATGPADIIALAPAGWALDAVNGYTSTSTSIYHLYEGETVLEAFVRLAELTGEHFQLGSGRKVIWTRAYNASTDKSGLRAFQSADAAALTQNDLACLITSLNVEQDSYDLVTRVYAYGIGEAGARVDLKTSTWSAPAGYTLDTTDGFIKRDAMESSDPPYQIVARYLSWKDVAATNTLSQTAYDWLRVHSETYKSYKMTVEKHTAAAIEPGKSIRVVYHRWIGGYHAINVDADLVVMERTHRIDSTGHRTLDFLVATTDRYPCKEGEEVASDLFRLQAATTHTQPISGSSGATAHNHVSNQVEPSITGMAVGGTLTSSNRVVLAEGTINITLPAAANKMDLRITNIDTGTITIKRAGSDTINGSSADITLTTQYSTYWLVSDGSSKWFANKI